MATNLLQFPVEVQEKVLSKLNGESLLVASQVCKLWHIICARIAKQRHSSKIPDECIVEIGSTCTEEAWLLAVRNHYLQMYFLSNMMDHRKAFTISLNASKNISFTSYESLLFVGNSNGDVNVYDTEDSTLSLKMVLTMEYGSQVIQMVPCALEELLIIVTSSNIEIWTLPPVTILTKEETEVKMEKLQPIFEDYCSRIECHRNISVDGNILLVVTDSYEVTLFRLRRDSILKLVHLALMNQYCTETAVSQATLWQNQVAILLTSGEVILWNIITDESNITDPYPEIRYQNPMWTLRGRIYCSTIISSQLLGYWHMDRGASYWLIGSPTSELIRCRDLGTMFSADTQIEDVLCVSIKQRLLACGTKEGKILLYYLSDLYFCENPDLTDEHERVINNSYVNSEFNRVPDLTIRTIERPIKDIRLEFIKDRIHIYTWPFMTVSGAGSSGSFQCIILSEGDWVLPGEKDAIY